MAGIKISIVDDVAGFLRGVGRVEDALGDVAGSLDDVAAEAAQAGQRSARELDSNFTAAGRDVTGQAEKMERSFRDLADTVKRESRTAGGNLGDNIKRGASDAGEGLENMRDEADGTAREVAASFDGSADSIAGGFQELAANAFGGFGPAGAAAGLAVAAGIGLAWSAFTKDAEAAKARITSITEDMIEAGTRVATADFVRENLRAIVTGSEDAAISLDNLRAASAETGESQERLAAAWAGDADARVALLEDLRGKMAAADADAVSLDNTVAASGVKRQAHLRRWVGALEDIGAEHGTAAARADLFGRASAEASRRSVARADEARDAFGRLRASVEQLPTTRDVTVSVHGDLSELDEQIRRYRPPVVVGQFRAGGVAVV